MRPRSGRAAALLLLALTVPACRGGGEKSAGGQKSASSETSASSENSAPTTAAPVGANPADVNPADFTARIDHPLVAFALNPLTVFEGTERDSETGKAFKSGFEQHLLDKTEVLAGVPVSVVEVKDYENGKLVEHTFDYYAQHRDGSVWYFGERIDEYEDGKVRHEGQWIAGEGQAKPGVFMPAEPKVGQEFQQERAPGVAEDRSTVLEVGLEVTTPAGRFTNCIKTKDVAPLQKTTEFKYYCPGVGLVREEAEGGRVDLIRRA
jgi:hypothetical protein